MEDGIHYQIPYNFCRWWIDSKWKARNYFSKENLVGSHGGSNSMVYLLYIYYTFL